MVPVMQPFPTFKKLSNLLWQAVGLAWGVAVIVALATATVTAPAHASGPVAVVTFAVGTAEVLRGAQPAQALKQGQNVAVGDTIRTGDTGVVHLRFNDQGRIALRESSELLLQEYQADPVRIRLELIKGTARSITGASAKRDPAGFRLSTPIMALGVRGTDFLVRSDTDTSHAFVISGAVVAAPIGTCASGAVATCLNGTDLQPTQLLALNARGERTLTTVQDALVDQIFGPAARLKIAAKPAGATSADDATAAKTTADKSPAIPSATGTQTTAQQPGALPVIQLRSTGDEPMSQQELSVAKALANPELSARSALVWGQWPFGPQYAEGFSTTWQQASAGRQITVGNSSYGLWRQGDQSTLPNLTESVQFNLAAGAAALTSASGVVTNVPVIGGNLAVDFAQRTFSTDVVSYVPGIGRTPVTAAGSIGANGLFHAEGTTGAVSGAISLDGAQAGYLFRRAMLPGLLEGITLWKR
jgi:hypothetical protein